MGSKSTKASKAKAAPKPKPHNPLNLGPAPSMYEPPSRSIPRLHTIYLKNKLKEGAQRVLGSFTGAKMILKLAGGQLYFDSTIALCTDGAVLDGKADKAHQSRTSVKANGEYIDANKVPYYVLPMAPGDFWTDLGIHVWDVAAMIYNEIVIFAVFTEQGPSWKLGEASIAVHRAFGIERVRKDGSVLDASIDKDVGIGENVVTIVFPGSAQGTPTTPEAIRAIGKPLFEALGGSAPPLPSELSAAAASKP